MIEKLDEDRVLGQLLQVRQILKQLLPGLGAIVLSTNLGVAGQLPESIHAVVMPQATPHNPGEPQNPLSSFPGISLSDLPPELQGEGKWEAFKTLWNALDALKPETTGTEPFDGKQLVLLDEAKGMVPMANTFQLPGYAQRQYYQALSAQQAADFQEKLCAIFDTDFDHLSLESQMLFRLTLMRIQELSLSERMVSDYVADERHIMTRMAPTFHTSQISPTYYLVSAVDRIQMRANILLDLRMEGAVGNEVYTATLDALLADAKLALYLDALTQPPQNTWSCDRLTPAPLRLNGASVDFQPQDFQDGSLTDLRKVQAWQDAVYSAYNRQKVNEASSSPTLTFYHRTALQIKALIQELSALRENLDLLDPVLTGLEH